MNTLELQFEYREADLSDPVSFDEVEIGNILMNNERVRISHNTEMLLIDFIYHIYAEKSSKI